MLNKDTFTKFSDAQVGETISRPVLVASISENIAKNGKPFLRVNLKDGFSEITANMFETSAKDLEDLNIYKETIADVKLAVSEYQGSKSFKINEICPAKDKSITLGDFVKVPPVDPDVMYDEICSLIRKSADDCGGKYTALSELALEILSDKKASYMTSSAAVSMHHNLKGGLLYHSYRMVKAADAICNVYTTLDKELLLCGAALHDIGKIWEYKTSASGDAEFTTNGVLFGHLYMGASLIKQYSQKHSYNKEKVQLLTHLILSHHGTLEWGAVSCPAVAEAFALHYIDNLDAKMYTCEEQCENLNFGEMTEKKPFGLDNRIYKPDYNK